MYSWWGQTLNTGAEENSPPVNVKKFPWLDLRESPNPAHWPISDYTTWHRLLTNILPRRKNLAYLNRSVQKKHKIK